MNEERTYMSARKKLDEDRIWAVEDRELVRSGSECVARLLCRYRRPKGVVSPFRYKRYYEHPSGARIVFHVDKHTEIVHLAEGFQLVPAARFKQGKARTSPSESWAQLYQRYQAQATRSYTTPTRQVLASPFGTPSSYTVFTQSM